MVPTATTLKALCAAQNNPYHQVCYDTEQAPLLSQRLDEFLSYSIRTPTVYCGRASDVHIFGRSFLYTKDDAYIFHCQSYQNHKGHNLRESLEAFIEKRSSSLFADFFEEECIFLGGMNVEQYPDGPSYLRPGAANFGHFIFEYLNRLAIFDLYGLTQKLPIVVYDMVPERWLGFLELLGVSQDRIVRVPVANPPAFRNVWVSSSCHYRGSDGTYRFWGEGLQWARLRMLSAIGGPRVSNRSRVYLGREDAKWRKPVNEDEVKRLLATYGFVFPAMSKMTPREQIETISGAEIVVAAAGANTVLTHFAPQHCINILMYPRNVGTGPWGGLGASLFLRQIYERLECNVDDSAEIFQTNEYGLNEFGNYKADLFLLRDKVERALRISSAHKYVDALEC